MNLRGPLFGFVLAGMIGGIMAGAIDALGALESGAPVLVLLGSIGLHALVGGALGVGAGLLFPLVPTAMTARHLFEAVKVRVRPPQSMGLYDRCRVVATAWLVVGVGFVGLHLLAAGNALVLSRVQSPEFSAVAVAGLSLLGVAGAAALFAPLHAGLARGLEFAVRRRPELTALAHPAVHVTLAGLAALVLLFASLVDELETLKALDLRPVVSAVVLIGPMLVLGEILARPLATARTRRTLIALSFLMFFAGAAATAGLRAPESRRSITTQGGSSRLLVALMRAPFDADGDGYADVLYHGDCDDTDPNVHPAARDKPGNGLDEDCDGVDTPLPPPEPPPPLPPTEPAALGLEPPYNVVLITVDALRADHLGVYGYRRPTSPSIDELAEDAIVFRRAYSPSAKTPTAIPALMTGRYPSELVRDGAHFTTYGPANRFLAETLQTVGYRTAGFPSHWYFEPQYGLNQGFEVWQPYSAERGRMEKQPTAETVVVSAVEWLQTAEPDRARPFFLWLHLLDPHKDYIEHLDVPRFGDDPIDRYDHEIRYTDTWLDYLFDTLSRRADWDRTIVVLTSDHGEAFGEHGYRYHGFGLHEHQLHVPLIMRVPGLKPQRVKDRVGLIDVTPTLLDLAGVRPSRAAREAMDLRGVTLLPLLGGFERDPRPIFAEMPKGPYNAAQFAFIEGDRKLLFSGAGNAWQMFDLEADPGEQDDLAPGDARGLQAMRAALNRFRAGLDIRDPVGDPTAEPE